MKDLLDKIGSYNIFNYLFPGVIFSIFITKCTHYNLIQEDILVGAFVYYFVGSVISRIGSLFLEPILLWSGFVSFSSYNDFVTASKADEKLEVLLEANNMYRTILSLFLCVLVAYVYSLASEKFEYLNGAMLWVCVTLLIIIYALSYRKQSAYIKKRVSINVNGVSK